MSSTRKKTRTMLTLQWRVCCSAGDGNGGAMVFVVMAVWWCVVVRQVADMLAQQKMRRIPPTRHSERVHDVNAHSVLRIFIWGYVYVCLWIHVVYMCIIYVCIVYIRMYICACSAGRRFSMRIRVCCLSLRHISRSPLVRRWRYAMALPWQTYPVHRRLAVAAATDARTKPLGHCYFGEWFLFSCHEWKYRNVKAKNMPFRCQAIRTTTKNRKE